MSRCSRSTSRFPLALAASALALAALACGEPAPPPVAGAAAGGGAPLRVRTVAALARDTRGETAPGTVLARRRATLAPRVAASVHALPFEEGERVRTGDVVVALDDGALRAALAAAEVAGAAARADADRYGRLLGREAATPHEAAAASATAAAATAAVAGAREALAYARLRAPFSGRLVRRLVREGDVVAPGQALVELEGDAGFELRVTLAGGEAATLLPGARLLALVDGAGEVGATVRAVSPAGDPASHRFEAIADLDAAPGLRSGLFGRLRLPAGEDAGSELAVPAGAVFARGGLTGVFVAEGGVARLRWIAAGARRDGLVVVRAGLVAGERVVVDPVGLADGVAVAGEGR
jgi:RND family efflux transporter MFP subunit